MNSEEIKSKIKQLNIELRQAEARERTEAREKDLDTKRPTKFPPGFNFIWYHRHDPFEGYYKLCLDDENGKEILSWKIEDVGGETELNARTSAWALFDQAVDICKIAGLINAK